MKPVRLTASQKEKPWGTRDLEPWFKRPAADIGEVWFTAEPRLPILVKFLFTSGRLSVQLHPGGPRGKTEMWHVLRAREGAKIALGFREPVTRERLAHAVRTGEVVDLLRWIPVAAGETYFIPPGTVHAIGAGIALCEIQQNCDVTLRLYDYGSGRELHVEQALALADLGCHPGACAPDSDLLASCEYFATESLRITAPLEYAPDADRFHLFIVLEGRGGIGGIPFTAGEVWQIPAGAERFTIHPAGEIRALRVRAP